VGRRPALSLPLLCFLCLFPGMKEGRPYEEKALTVRKLVKIGRKRKASLSPRKRKGKANFES